MARDAEKTPTVLVVENNGEVLDLVTNIVSVQGWKPIAAASLGEARNLLRDNRVDAIVTDLSLDDGDGLELVREVRAGSTPSIPMLIISSYATPEMRDLAQQAGAIDLMGKPFRLSRFAQVLSEALGVRTGAAAPTLP